MVLACLLFVSASRAAVSADVDYRAKGTEIAAAKTATERSTQTVQEASKGLLTLVRVCCRVLRLGDEYNKEQDALKEVGALQANNGPPSEVFIRYDGWLIGRVTEVTVKCETWGDTDLYPFEDMPYLEQIVLQDTGVSESGVERLRQALPHTEITLKNSEGK